MKKIIYQTLILKKMRYLKNYKNLKYNDHEVMVYRFQLIYDEFIDILDLQNIPTKEQAKPFYISNKRYKQNPKVYFTR